MSGLNKVILIGNLGKDPEMRFTPNGDAVTSFSVGVNDGKETEWFNIVAWKKLAETCNQFLSKGKQVCVEGRLHTRTWDGDDGQKHYKTEVNANKVVFLGAKDTPEREATKPGELEPDDIPF